MCTSPLRHVRGMSCVTAGILLIQGKILSYNLVLTCLVYLTCMAFLQLFLINKVQMLMQ